MILVDAGPVVAVFDRSDPEHRRCAAFLNATPEELRMPTVVIAEVAHFLGRDRRIADEAQFLRSIASGNLPSLDPGPPDYLRAADLVLQYADFPLGAVDALIVAMAERLNVTTIFTLDRRHFGTVRPAHCDSLTLVP